MDPENHESNAWQLEFLQRTEVKLEKEDYNTFSPDHHGENKQSEPNSPQDPLSINLTPRYEDYNTSFPHHHGENKPSEPKSPQHPLSINLTPRYEISKYYEASVHYRARIAVIIDIRAKLTVAQRRLFKATCFGPWLEVQSTVGDPLLTHLILQTQIFPEPPTSNEMWFDIGGHQVRFGRQEFCLVTGLRFGSIADMSKWLSGRYDNTFRYRVFPDVPAHKSVRVSDLVQVFTNTDFTQMEDLDAVRICLLLLLEIGFMGRRSELLIASDLLQLVENLDTWNEFPWGSYIWAGTYKQLMRGIPRRVDEHMALPMRRVARYTLLGFIWAFRVWIFEAFPCALEFATRDKDVIPRAIAWRKKQSFTWKQCHTFLHVKEGCEPRRTLIPTDEEMATDWWMASWRYFDSVDDEYVRTAKKARATPPQWLDEIRASSISAQHHHHTFDLPHTTLPRADTTLFRADTTTLREDATTRLSTMQTPLDERVAALEAGQCAIVDGVDDGYAWTAKARATPPRWLDDIPPSLAAQHHHQTFDLPHTTSPRVDTTLFRVDTTSLREDATTKLSTMLTPLDERVSALEAGQCAIMDMVTRTQTSVSLLSQTVHLLHDRVEKDSAICSPNCLAGNKPSTSSYGVGAHALTHDPLTDEKMQKIVNVLIDAGISHTDVGKAAEVCYNDPIKVKVLFALPRHMIRSYAHGFL